MGSKYLFDSGFVLGGSSRSNLQSEDPTFSNLLSVYVVLKRCPNFVLFFLFQ